jgi:site-specific DNA-adenine methylase
MLYLGGKQRIAHCIRKHILAEIPRHERGYYIEPFCGGMSTFVQIAHYFEKSQATDDHKDLMLMWIAAQEGWRPPFHVTEAEYRRLQKSYEHRAPEQWTQLWSSELAFRMTGSQGRDNRTEKLFTLK